MALHLAERLDQKQATDIRILDVSGPLVIADYFLVATVQSTRQAQSLAKELDMAHKSARGHRKRNGGSEGEDTNWVLLDFNDIVVHLFLPEARDYFGLERLWADVPRLEFTSTAAPQGDAGPEVRQPTLDGFGAFQPLEPDAEGSEDPADDDPADDGPSDDGPSDDGPADDGPG